MPTHARRPSMYLPSALLLSLEAALFLGVAIFALAVHTELPPAIILFMAATHAITALAAMSSINLYSSRRSSFPGLMLRIGLALGMAAFISALIQSLTPAGGHAFVAATTVITFLASMTIRATFDCIREPEAAPRRILVLGAGHRAAQIARLRRYPWDRQSFELLGYVPAANDQANGIAAELCVDVREDLLAYCKRQNVEEIVIAMDDRRQGLSRARLKECRAAGIGIIHLGAFLEREVGGIRYDALDLRVFARRLQTSLAGAKYLQVVTGGRKDAPGLDAARDAWGTGARDLGAPADRAA
ncbi:MAG: hypothetical protein ABW171_08060 [Steroidobacter sp.]